MYDEALYMYNYVAKQVFFNPTAFEYFGKSKESMRVEQRHCLIAN